jgi:hypothetical protein
MRTRLILFIGFLALIASPGFAQEGDKYPLLDAGVVKIKAAIPESDPAFSDTASVCVVQLNGSAGETILPGGIAPDVAPGQTVLFSAVTVENPGDGQMGILKARAYAASGCAGDLFTDSVNTAFVRFVGPGAPVLVDPVGDADVTVP